VLYQGDEIGLGDIDVAHEDMRDPLGVAYFPAYAGRDAMRTPMPWRPGPGGGFTEPGTRPWLPLGDTTADTVEDERSDPGSVLSLARDLIALRRSRADLRTGGYAPLSTPPGVWAWRRGVGREAGLVVVLNLSDEEATVEGIEGRILVATDRGRDGESAGGGLSLAPWEGLIVETG
jgi:alpha-glucosidase